LQSSFSLLCSLFQHISDGVQRDSGTAIFETAGRASRNHLGTMLGAISPGRTRVIGPVVYSKRQEIERVMERFAVQLVNRVNRELKK